MTPFKCRGCRMVSKVREVKYQSGACILFASAGRENALRRDKATETTVIPFEIVGVRPQGCWRSTDEDRAEVT
jgi:hypothetical protein